MAGEIRKPRSVQPFWIEAQIDGLRGTRIIKGGPVSSGGCIRIDIWQRDRGVAVKVLEIEGFSIGDEHVLNIRNGKTGEPVHQVVTKRDKGVR